MKRNIVFIILAAVITLTIYGIGALTNYSDIRIEEYSADITLTENGDMEVKESWIYHYPDGYTVRYRDIGYGKYNPNNPLYQDPNNRAYLDKNNIKVEVTDKAGNKLSSADIRFSGQFDERGEIIECEPYSSECVSAFVRIPQGMPETIIFNYEYTIEGAITKYRDIAELNAILLEYFEADIEKAYVKINLPNIPKEDIRAWGHGLANGDVIIENNRIILDIKRIKTNEFLEVRILLPEAKFNVDASNFINRDMETEILNYQQALADETNMRIRISKIIFYGTFAMLAVMLAFAYIAYIKYDKEHIAKFQGKYYRELPAEYSPAEMSYLYYFRKIKDEDLTATLLDLIRRKYLLLDQNNQGINDKNPNFKLILNPEKGFANLKPHEEHLLLWFIRDIGNNNEVTLQQIENYPKIGITQANNFKNKAAMFVKKAKAEGMKHDFFEKKIAAQKSRMFLAASIPLIYLFISLVLKGMYNIEASFALIASIVSFAVYVFYIVTIDKRSINGNEEYAKWKAFRNFLLDFGNMKDYPIPGIVIWEHYLVYATSLKVADKVMEQLKVRLPKVPDSDTQATYLGIGYHYPAYHWYAWGRINNTISVARQNQFQTIAAHNASKVSGGGRGGGFGGGSSFGGFGGGSRSR